jgi:hypothetical protein
MPDEHGMGWARRVFGVGVPAVAGAIWILASGGFGLRDSHPAQPVAIMLYVAIGAVLGFAFLFVGWLLAMGVLAIPWRAIHGRGAAKAPRRGRSPRRG